MAGFTRSEVVTGIFVTAAVAVFVLFAFRVGNWQPSFLAERALECRTTFRDVAGLVVGSKVRTAGREVGRVTRLRWDELEIDDAMARRAFAGELGLQSGDRIQVVRVDFELSSADLRLDPATARVALAQEGLLGQHFLDLHPGSWRGDTHPPAALDLEGEAPLAIEPYERPGLAELMSDAGPALASLTGILEELHASVFSARTLARVDRATLELADMVGRLARYLDRETEGNLHDEILVPLQSVLERSNQAMAGLDGLVADSRPRVDRILQQVEVTAASLDARLDALQSDLGGTIAQIDGLLGDAGASVRENRPELAETLRRLRRTMWHAEMAARKIRANPALLLFGDDEPDPEQHATDETGQRLDGRARPFGLRGGGGDGR